MSTPEYTTAQQIVAITSRCRKCGIDKRSGKPTCCARGGNWYSDCGSVGDANFSHTWAEGLQACKDMPTTTTTSQGSTEQLTQSDYQTTTTINQFESARLRSGLRHKSIETAIDSVPHAGATNSKVDLKKSVLIHNFMIIHLIHCVTALFNRNIYFRFDNI